MHLAILLEEYHRLVFRTSEHLFQVVLRGGFVAVLDDPHTLASQPRRIIRNRCSVGGVLRCTMEVHDYAAHAPSGPACDLSGSQSIKKVGWDRSIDRYGVVAVQAQGKGLRGGASHARG